MTTPYSELAAEFGTPLYIYDSRVILRQVETLRSALTPSKPTVCFAVKALSTLSILKLMADAGLSFDIVAEGELRRLEMIGVNPQQVVFSGVGKTESEIEYALTKNIRALQVESLAELALISTVAAKLRCVAPISFRMNPAVDVETHPHLATGLATSKFGIATSEILRSIPDLRSNTSVKVIGLSCHIGSNIRDVAPYAQAFHQVVTTYDQFCAAGIALKFIDFGGGIGVSYGGKYSDLDLTAYADAIRKSIGDRQVELLLEPGKFLVAEAGELLTKVTYTKINGGRCYAVVDAGMNDLIRPALYDAYHPISRVDGLRMNDDASVCDVVGPVCESGCAFGHDRRLGDLQPGDLLTIGFAGAYGSTMSSNYNSRRRAAEVLIENDGQVRLIRERESWDSLWRGETMSRV